MVDGMATKRGLVVLSGAQLLATALGLVTAPLLARALGPDGRGDLATVLAPLALVPVLLGFGLGDHVRREVARGGRPARFLAAAGAPLCVVGLLVAVTAPWVAASLTVDDSEAHRWLAIGLLLTPLTLPGALLLDVLAGQQRWTARASLVVVPAAAGAVGTAALFATGTLTVGSAAAVSLIATSGTALVSLLVVRDALPPRLTRGGVLVALRFGLSVWTARATNVLNMRVDQVVLIPLVPAADLGRYVVAVTVGTLPTLLAGPLAQVLEPLVARDSVVDPARVVRVATALTAVQAVLLALLVDPLLRWVFGAGFVAARTSAWVLLAASVPFVVRLLLRTLLTSSGRPASSIAPELSGLAVTACGLAVLVPALGVDGAAVTSLASYTAAATVALVVAARSFGVPVAEFVGLRRSDASWAAQVALRRKATSP